MHVHVHVHVQVHVGGRVMSATSVAELHTHMYGHPWAHAHTTLICTLIIINHDRLSPTPPLEVWLGHCYLRIKLAYGYLVV